VTAREVIKRLEKEGWSEVRQTGSHKHFIHAEKPGLITVAVHSGDIPVGTYHQIAKAAGWR
jgi:predicted RNA binding protein YcfA (HicA-like mRNA interferase family)